MRERDGNFRRGLVATTLCATALLFSGSALAAHPQALQRGDAHYQSYLMQEVRHQLVMLPYLSVFDNLQYSVNGNNVTLSGEVTQPWLKDDAVKAVKGIEGVEQVNDQIEVLPLSPMDNQIRRAEFRAIYSFPSLQKYGMQAVQSIHIVVKNGHVTLDGLVLSQADKNAADLRAKTVPNVFSVTDNLQVQNSSAKSGQ